MILICYDGSPDSLAAIDSAGQLMPGEAATVLTVWEPFNDAISRTGAGMFYSWPEQGRIDQVDDVSERGARARAEEGVERARQAGLNPQPRTRSRGATIAETILSEADEVEAKAVVLGTRGLAGLKSLMLGSVSHAVTQHADRPVIVVPSPVLAATRTARRHAEQEAA